ncbi:MAG: hypothetical protein AAFQ94_13075 [Bacteroidota bacterium]
MKKKKRTGSSPIKFDKLNEFRLIKENQVMIKGRGYPWVDQKEP